MLLYLFSYSIGLISIAASLIYGQLSASHHDKAFGTSMLVFTVLMISNTFLFTDALTLGISDLLSFSAMCLMIHSLPRFLHGLCYWTPGKLLDKISLGIAGILIILLITTSETFYFLIQFRFIVENCILGVFFASIIYTCIFGNIVMRRRSKELERLVCHVPDFVNTRRLNEFKRWSKMFLYFTYIIIILMPISLFIDFFPLLRDAGLLYIPSYLHIYPFIYLAWNLLYLWSINPSLQPQKMNPVIEEKTEGCKDLEPAIPIRLIEIAQLKKLGLSTREQEVASLLVQGLTYQEIADKLYVSLSTIKTHTTRIYTKTKCRTKVELVHILLEK